MSSSLNRRKKLNLNIKQDKYGYFPIWIETDNNQDIDTIIKASKKHQKKIKDLTEILNEDYRNIKNIILQEDKKEEKISDKKDINKNTSEKVNKILNNVDKIFSKIKNSQEELSELNMKSLLDMKEKIISSDKIEEPNDLIKQKEKEYKDLLDLKHKTKKKSLHYRFLSEHYRRQLNKVLLKFNPLKHLENINSLRKDNPEINEEFNRKTKLIESELYNITSPNFFKNNSKKFQKTFFNKNKKELSLPKISYLTTTGFHPMPNYYPTQVDFPNKKNSKKTQKSGMNLYNYNYNTNLFLKKNKMKKFPDKENRKLELELMENVCKNMMNSIDKVDSNENDFYNTFSKLNSDERKNLKEKILEEKSEAEKILVKIKNNNLMKGVKDDMIIKRKKGNEDIKNYGKQITFIRDEIINNIEQKEFTEQNFLI